MNTRRKPARMGRPPLFPEEGARIGHSLRLKPSVDQAVREAADRNSRSLAEEMEHRINKSFDDESDIEKTIEYRLNQRLSVIKLQFDIKECMFEWRQAIDTKFMCDVYKTDYIHKGSFIKRLRLTLGNRLIRLINIEGEKTEINLRGLEEKGNLAQSRIEYYKERYKQLNSELANKLTVDQQARASLTEEEAMQVMQTDRKLNQFLE